MYMSQHVNTWALLSDYYTDSNITLSGNQNPRTGVLVAHLALHKVFVLSTCTMCNQCTGICVYERTCTVRGTWRETHDQRVTRHHAVTSWTSKCIHISESIKNARLHYILPKNRISFSEQMRGSTTYSCICSNQQVVSKLYVKNLVSLTHHKENLML